MRSARNIFRWPPFRLALCLVVVLATVSVATPNMLSLFAPAVGDARPAAAAPAIAAIEGWVTSSVGSVKVAGAQVSIESGPSTTSDEAGYFSFSPAQVSQLAAQADTQFIPVTVSVHADGYSAWTIKSARFYEGDTLRLYPVLGAVGVAPQVDVAAAPRGADEVSTGADPGESLSSMASIMGNMPLSLGGNTLASTSIASMVESAAAASSGPPASIRVYRTGTGAVEVVPFKDYVKHVLPNEWIPTWTSASLRAGAIAVKEYGWYWVYNGGKQVALGADVKDNTEDQVYDPNVSYASTDAAVEATWQYALLRNGALFQAQYCAGSYAADPTGDCPWSGPYMTQWGSAYYSDQGMTWDWILRFYYPNCTISPNVPGGGPAPAPPAPVAPAPTKAPTTFTVGQGSTQPEVFQEAYDRTGGKARLGTPIGAVRWWLTYISENNVLAQPFTGADGSNNTWLVFDTLKSQVSDIRRAYIVEGKIAEVYAQHDPAGPEWVGAPTSDPYTGSAQAGGMTSQGFSRGTLAWNGQGASFTPWPTQFNNWQARYFVGKPPASLLGAQADLPGQPAMVLDQSSPNLDWAADSGVARSMGLGDGAWSAQFTWQSQLEAGNYDIALTADSGLRLWVDNLLAINSWDATAGHTEQYNLDLDGASHAITVQYFSPGSTAKLVFTMTKREIAAPPAAPPSTDPGAGNGVSSVPGASPTGSAGLRVKVRWLGRPDPPSESWSQPLTLLLSAPNNPMIVGTYIATTDRNGVAIYSALPEGTYDVHVKGIHSLQSARASVVLGANRTTEVDMKAQIEGDLDGDNCVTVQDFSVVQAMVGTNRNTPGWNAAADLNNDGHVTASDVSLLRSGFDMCGDISADTQLHTLNTSEAPTFEQQLAPWLDPASMRHDLSMTLSASQPSAKPGDIVVVKVYADTGEQAIDGASFILQYDPTMLAPVDSKGNATTISEPGVSLPAVLGNWIDTQGGAVGYAASMLQGTAPEGLVPLATLRFRALQAGSTEMHFAPLSLGEMQITNGGANLLAKTSSLTLSVNP